MSILHTLNWVIAALLLITAALGALSARAWARHRPGSLPPAKFWIHLATQAAAIALWLVFSLSWNLAVAWLSFALLTAGQVVGDMLMFASHRARQTVPPSTPGTDRGSRPSYGAAAADTLSFRRPAPALHAIIGALSWFGMLAVSIAASVLR